jgi:hypothetical protein
MTIGKLASVSAVFLLLSGYAYSRTTDPDSTGSSTVARKGPQFNIFPLDYRNTFVHQSPILALGGCAGLKFNGQHLFTLGYYWLSENSDRTIQTSKGNTHTLNDGVKLSYINLAYTYSFIHSKHWEIGVPVEVGLGFAKEAIVNESGRTVRNYVSNFVPIQAGITGDWKITRWVGLNLAIGYRRITLKTIDRDNFDGIYYNYGINVYTGNILDDYRAWRQRKRMKRASNAQD